MKSRPPGKPVRLLATCILPLASCLVPLASRAQQSPLDRIAITVEGPSREFCYTNKETAYLYGETNGENRSGWQGFNVLGHKFFDDYGLLIDGEPLERSSTVKTTVYPDYLVRTYKNGIVEQLRPVDGKALIGLIITSPRPVGVGLVPFFADGQTAGAFRVKTGEGHALIARVSHQKRTAEEDFPVWLVIGGKGGNTRLIDHRKGRLFSPVVLEDQRSKTHIFAFAVGDKEDDAASLAEGYPDSAAYCFKIRRERMERLLRQTSIQTEDPRLDESLNWAKLSLDALVMDQSGRGIFAGLPWFNNYWGRDTFIALPGAALVTGQFSLAKQVLRSFAAYQQTDSASTDYGRIPNFVTPGSKAYNTADATPRFVMMAREYILRSGDSTYMLEAYPTVLRSIEGTVRYHTDSLGFLVHGEAESWMDAVGPDGPWSPRGNRANDIQALWWQQLEAGIWFATRVGDAVSARSWFQLAGKLRKNFTRFFVVHNTVTDHLLADGSRDPTLRPNQIFDAPLLDDRMRARVARVVSNQLTYPYGVASLSQDDPDFHPYHVYPPLYPKDAAYHNGVVWTWLQGQLISELCRFDKEEVAFLLTRNAVHQILDRGAVGTQSELLDAVPRQGESEPRLSGTFSQAWNLAEFIRNVYDDYLGVRCNMYDHALSIIPHLPESVGNAKVAVNLEGTPLPVEIEPDGKQPSIFIDARRFNTTLNVLTELRLTPDLVARTTFVLEPKGLYRIEAKDGTVSVTRNGRSEVHRTSTSAPADEDSLLLPLGFVIPVVHPGLKSMRGPDYPLLTHAQIKASNPSAVTLVDASDPAGDDTGSGHYTYPSNPVFQPGIFDIRHFTVRYDSANIYCTLALSALTDPGWHPEYGFQLTYAAIALDEDGLPGSGTQIVGHNASYLLDPRHAYERLILVGGGIQVEDARGKILAAYSPSEPDAVNPLGSTATGTVSFAFPLSLLGTPSGSWTFTVLAGAQDDHGGAGIGEFRTVNRIAGEWNGGGKANPGDPNVYDTLVAHAK